MHVCWIEPTVLVALQGPSQGAHPNRHASNPKPSQDTHMLKLTQDILTRRTCGSVQPDWFYLALHVEDRDGKTSAIQLTWTDTGGQVQFAPIVTLSLRK